MLVALSVFVAFTDDFVPTDFGPNLRPACPVKSTQKQNADTNNRKHVVWVALRVPITIRGDEGDDREKYVCGQVKNSNRKVGMPWRLPALALVVVQVDEAGGNETVDPCSGVGV